MQNPFQWLMILATPFILVFGKPAFATNFPLEKDPKFAFDLISFEEFSSLPNSAQQIYVSGLQKMLSEINDLEASEFSHTGQWLFKNWICENIQGPSSWAEESVEGSPCVFAGNLLTKMANGYCQVPSQGSCTSGMIQCNPLIFGEGVCASPNVRATMNCASSSKPISEIINYISSHKETWTKFSADLHQYCETGHQAGPCRIIERRMTELSRATGADSKPAEHTVEAPPAKPSTPTPSASKEIPAAPHPSAKDDSKKLVLASSCRADLLLDTVHCASSVGNEPKKSEGNYLGAFDAIHAYQYFCVDKKIPANVDQSVPKLFAQAEACLKKDESSNDFVSRVTAKAALARLKSQIIPNYNRCAKMLSEGQFPTSTPDKTLQLNIDGTATLQNGSQSVKVGQNFLQPVFYRAKLSLCEVRVLPAPGPGAKSSSGTR